MGILLKLFPLQSAAIIGVAYMMPGPQLDRWDSFRNPVE